MIFVVFIVLLFVFFTVFVQDGLVDFFGLFFALVEVVRVGAHDQYSEVHRVEAHVNMQ